MVQREPAPVPPTPATRNVAPVHNRLGNNRDARDTIEARRRDRSDSSDEERRAPRGRDRRDDDRRDDRERSPTPDPHDVGPRAFSYQIRTARIPPRFRLPRNITKYDGETDPAVWLEDFRLSCRAGGAYTDELIIRNLPLYLGDPARHWLEHLPKGKIRSWSSLKDAFVGNFQCTCARPAMHWDLEQCVRRSGEKLRDYIQRFSRQYTACPEVPESKAIDAFFRGNKNRALVNRLGKRLLKTMKELMDIAVDEAMGEEAEYAMLPNQRRGSRSVRRPTQTVTLRGPLNAATRRRKRSSRGSSWPLLSQSRADPRVGRPSRADPWTGRPPTISRRCSTGPARTMPAL
jgi:hypothetical protein